LEVLIPVRWLVLFIAVIHTTIITLIVGIFVTSSKVGLFQNTWQVLAQGSRGETKAILENVNEQIDSEVRKMLKGDDLKKRVVGLSRDPDSGMMCCRGYEIMKLM